MSCISSGNPTKLGFQGAQAGLRGVWSPSRNQCELKADVGTSRETRSHRGLRADSKQANAEATSPDWSLPRGVCVRASVQGDLWLPAPNLQRGTGKGGSGIPPPPRLGITQGLFKVSLRTMF